MFFFIHCKKDSPISDPTEHIYISPKDTTILYIDTIKAVTSPTIGLEIGDVAPGLNIRDTANNQISLSSIKNKLVLLDFWAGWCKPCIQENKNLTNVYNTYKDATFKTAKGFEIYGVSLDYNRSIWINALKQNPYKWINVFDSLAWGSASANLYRITYIPYNFLINEKGIIVAKNLRGTSVDSTLKIQLE